jgi:hypothetical protein
MRRLTAPPFAARDVLDLCIESIIDENLTDRLKQIHNDIHDAEVSYIQYAESNSLFSIGQTDSVGGVSVDEMKRVYKGTFARSRRTRDIYDKIKKLSVNDICPMCGQRTIGTLDHYLAQSRHPSLVITPSNLLPSCGDCNKAKLDAQPSAAHEQTIHPYFDDLDDATWLFATVNESAPASLIFRPNPPTDWTNLKRDRLRHHFKKFRLGELYASHSGAELLNIQYGLRLIAERGVPDDIRSELACRAESYRAAQPNSWQTAMYAALANSDWFCAGGYD